MIRELTEKQLRLASNIARKTDKLAGNGADDISLFCDMADHMPDFKWLMDTAKPGDMERLCERFEGFNTYANLLEKIAQGIASGTIPAK